MHAFQALQRLVSVLYDPTAPHLSPEHMYQQLPQVLGHSNHVSLCFLFHQTRLDAAEASRFLCCFHLCSHRPPSSCQGTGTDTCQCKCWSGQPAPQSPTIDPASWVSRDQASLHNHPGLVIIIIITLSSKERIIYIKKKKRLPKTRPWTMPPYWHQYLASLCRRESCLIRPHPFARSALLMRCSLELGPRGICCPRTSSSS